MSISDHFYWRRAALRAAALAAITAGVISCNASGGGNQVSNTLGNTRTPEANAALAGQGTEVQDPRAYCPKTVLRAGTETYNVLPDKMTKADPLAAKALRYRATITEIVRECNYSGPVLNMKIGVAGRLISGPAGESGQFLMPIRVAVTRGDEVLYTTLNDVTAEIPPGRTNSTFNFVESSVSFAKPERENIVIYVGFDELRIDPPGLAANSKPEQPVVEEKLPKLN